jgi:hypothetical protein
MADQTYMSAPEFIVEFPEVDPPNTHKVEDFSEFVPVRGFNRAGRVPKGGGSYTDGNSKLMKCVPIQIHADEVICTLLNPIMGIGIIDKKMKLVELGRDNEDGQTERYEATLEGLEFEPMGDAAVLVTYQWYESKLFRKGESTLRQEFDFITNKAKD